MPKRLIEYEAMWGSTKLSHCREEMIPEYAWLYGLADSNGSFEITNYRIIWAHVAAIRPNMTVEYLSQIFAEFHRHGLLFIWTVNGKKYGHWTGSEVPGRLPPPAHRSRYEHLAPEVPKNELHQYEAGVISSFYPDGVGVGVGVGLNGNGVGLSLNFGDSQAHAERSNGKNSPLINSTKSDPKPSPQTELASDRDEDDYPVLRRRSEP